MVRRDHPRIFFNRDTWPQIEAAAHGAASDALARLVARCEGYPANPVCTGTELPPDPPGTSISLDSTPIPDIRDWGDAAAACALAWRFTKRAEFLEKTKAMLRANARGFDEAYANRRAVSWYAYSRINSFCAYDWIFEALTDDERRSLVVPLLESVDRFTTPTGRPKIRRQNYSLHYPGSYGDATIDVYAGLAAFGDGHADALADRMLTRGYESYRRVYERHLDGQTGERMLGSETPGYSLGTPLAFNFLQMHLAATGVNLAPRFPGMARLADWLWWLWIPDADDPERPMYAGFGDDRHIDNHLPDGSLRTGLAWVVHFYRESDPVRAKLAASLMRLVRQTPFDADGHWPLVPFILGADAPLAPFSLDDLRRAKTRAARFDRFGHVFMRSGWDVGSTYAFLGAGCTGQALHKHYDEGGFVIYKNDFLALDSGSRAAQTDYNLRYYYGQSVAHNVVLVGKPGEKLPSHWGPELPKADVVFNDGGMTGVHSKVLDFRTTGDWTYVAVDLAEAYGGKCPENVRQFVHVQPDYFVVYDRVVAQEAAWPKRWLLHVANEPEVSGRVVRADSRGGRLFCEALLPEDAEIAKIGGEGREFFSSGRDWPIEESWRKFQEERCRKVGRGPYWGSWRLETRPGAARKEDRFLHVLTAATTNVATSVAARLVKTANADGVVLSLPDGREACVTFARRGAATAEVKVKAR